MTTIPYTFTVIEASETGVILEYTSPGRETIRMATHVPRVGETVEHLAAMYSPVNLWHEQEAMRYVPEVGASGSVTIPEPEPLTLERAKAARLQELADWRFARETSGILLNGARIKTDRESQATVTGAFISISQGLATEIDWKAEGGVWVKLTLPEITAIAQAVVSHVQAAFTAESQIAALINAATTIEDVQAIEFPDVVVA